MRKILSVFLFSFVFLWKAVNGYLKIISHWIFTTRRYSFLLPSHFRWLHLVGTHLVWVGFGIWIQDSDCLIHCSQNQFTIFQLADLNLLAKYIVIMRITFFSIVKVSSVLVDSIVWLSGNWVNGGLVKNPFNLSPLTACSGENQYLKNFSSAQRVNKTWATYPLKWQHVNCWVLFSLQKYLLFSHLSVS